MYSPLATGVEYVPAIGTVYQIGVIAHGDSLPRYVFGEMGLGYRSLPAEAAAAVLIILRQLFNSYAPGFSNVPDCSLYAVPTPRRTGVKDGEELTGFIRPGKLRRNAAVLSVKLVQGYCLNLRQILMYVLVAGHAGSNKNRSAKLFPFGGKLSDFRVVFFCISCPVSRYSAAAEKKSRIRKLPAYPLE